MDANTTIGSNSPIQSGGPPQPPQKTSSMPSFVRSIFKKMKEGIAEPLKNKVTDRPILSKTLTKTKAIGLELTVYSLISKEDVKPLLKKLDDVNPKHDFNNLKSYINKKIDERNVRKDEAEFEKRSDEVL